MYSYKETIGDQSQNRREIFGNGLQIQSSVLLVPVFHACNNLQRSADAHRLRKSASASNKKEKTMN